MIFPSSLPQPLREALQKLHIPVDFSDFLQQLALRLREGTNAAGVSLVVSRGEMTAGASVGTVNNSTEKLRTSAAESMTRTTQIVPLSELQISQDGFFIPVGSQFLAIDELAGIFAGGIFVFNPQETTEIFLRPDVLPLILSPLLERAFSISESFPIGTFAHDMKHYLLLSEAACDRLSDTITDAEPALSIRAALQRMQVLTSTLLLTERDRTKALRLHPIRVSVGEIVRDVINSFQPIALRCGVALHYIDSESSLEAEIDPSLFPSIITNLIDNALKYCPRGSTVTVEVSSTASELKLAVKDDGPGIHQSEYSLIFTRGYRGLAHNQASGHGFGLAIVKRLVELHRGTVDLEETVGGGCTFVVVIPKHS